MRLYLFTEAKFDGDSSVVRKECNNKKFKLNHDDSSKSDQPSTSMPKDDEFLPDSFKPFLDLMIFENIPENLLNYESDIEKEFHVTDEEKQMQQSLLDNFNELNETLQNEFVVLKLHRGRVLNKYEDVFVQNDFKMRHQTLQIKMILPNIETESAEDSGGVLRDCLSEYWNSFYTERTTGNKLEVPVLLHTVNR